MIAISDGDWTNDVGKNVVDYVEGRAHVALISYSVQEGNSLVLVAKLGEFAKLVTERHGCDCDEDGRLV
jgi:hypothetical protein